MRVMRLAPMVVIPLIRRVTAPASVPILDANGVLLGYGPAADPQGIFFGFQIVSYSDEIWWVSAPPAGVPITPEAGGRFRWDPSRTVTGQQYSFDAIRKRIATDSTSNWHHTFTA